ncbi:hypothetical protein Bbelb_317370 [Branchiostoma belcheri]|nr:hypothetical protein Bbelb_317370 [Branchiostoma belcheri]
MEGMKVKIHHIVNITSVKLTEVQEETKKDKELQMLQTQVMEGWPERRNQVEPELREYWSIRDDISVEDGILLAGSRIIIPKTITCQKHRVSQQKEEMTPMEVPSRPWKTLGIDLFHLNQQWYLLLADYYSKFPVVKSMKDLRASTVMTAVKGIFAEQGVPDQLICDNGTQFTSQEFHQLAAERRNNWYAIDIGEGDVTFAQLYERLVVASEYRPDRRPFQSGHNDERNGRGVEVALKVQTARQAGEFATPRVQTAQEAGEFATPRVQTARQAGEFATPRVQKARQAGEFGTPRVQTGQQAGEFATPRVQTGQQAGEFATPRVQTAQEAVCHTRL